MEHPKEVSPHYHTACRNCGNNIIMGQSVYPPHHWMPYDLNGKGHDCPRRVQPDYPSRNQARSEA